MSPVLWSFLYWPFHRSQYIIYTAVSRQVNILLMSSDISEKGGRGRKVEGEGSERRGGGGGGGGERGINKFTTSSYGSVFVPDLNGVL